MRKLVAQAVDYVSPRIIKWALNLAMISVAWFSIVSAASILYFVMYWIMIPKTTVRLPVYFDYTSSHGNAYAEVFVTRGGKQWNHSPIVSSNAASYDSIPALTSGEIYEVTLELSAPLTHVNTRTGLLMVKSSLISEHGNNTKVLIASSKRPFIPGQWSFAGTFIARSIGYSPLYVFPIFENLVEHSKYKVLQADLILSGDTFQVQNASLQFSVQLSGLRWFIHKWFLTSAFFGIFQLSCIIGLVIFSIYVFYTNIESPISSPINVGLFFPQS